MRILLIVTCLANIAFAFGSIPWMPERMAIRFAFDGTPSGFMSPVVSGVMMSVTVCFVAVIILGVSFFASFVATHMPEFVNVPNRDYWMSEENRQKTVRRICSHAELIGVSTMLFILLVQWELFNANQMVPPKLEGSNVHIAVGVLLAVIAIDTVRMLLSFRLPKEND